MVKNIQLTVSEKNITSEDCPLRWSSNTVDYITATFALDDEWKSCDLVRAVWVAPQAQIVTVLDANDTCVVPHEVLSKIGKVYVNLYGIVYTDGEEFTRITTYPYNAIRIDGDAKIEGSETAPITPSQFEQFVETVLSETQKVTGMTATAETLPAGEDATASYSDGVLSFGIPQGEQGVQGVQGIQGERGETGAAGNGIESVTKTGTSGLVDTYTILFTDGTSTTFTVTNGQDGSADIHWGDVQGSIANQADLQNALNAKQNKLTAGENITIQGDVISATGGGGDITVDSALSSTSTNPVQNKVITSALNAKANTSSLASVATTGSYNDLSNKPTIPTVPTKVSAFTNDAGYITSVPSEYVTETELNTAIAGKANTADLATVATSGDYADLSGKPTIPTVPTNVSAFTNDAHYITSAGAPVQSVNGQTGAVTVTVPTKTSDLQNDSGYITSAPVSSVDGKTGTVTVIPTGGTTGQVLAKASNTDRDVEWVNQSGGGGSSPWTNDETVLASGTFDSETQVAWHTTPIGLTIGDFRRYKYFKITLKMATSSSIYLCCANKSVRFMETQPNTQHDILFEFLDKDHRFYRYWTCSQYVRDDADSPIFYPTVGTLAGDYPSNREAKPNLKIGYIPEDLLDTEPLAFLNNVAQTGDGIWKIRGAIEE